MRYLPRDNKIYLAQDGVTEIQGPGYEDKRLFIVTIFDPFDFVGMCRGRNMEKRFWETHQEGRAETVEPAESGQNADVEKGTKSNVVNGSPEVR